MDVIIDGYIYHAQKVGGISRIFNEVLPVLNSLDPNLSIKILMQDRKPELDEQIEQIIIPNLEKYFRPWSLWKEFHPILNGLLIDQRIKQTKNKVFHSTYYRSLKGWQGKQVLSVYDLIHEKYPALFADTRKVLHLKSQAFKRADHIICISGTTKEDLVHYYDIPDEKISIGLLACNQQFRTVESTEINFRVGTPFILYLGGRSSYKGFSNLVNTYSHWKFRHDVHLVVVGDEWTRQETDLLSRAGIQDCVLLFGNINDQQLCDLYNQARAFIYPSHYEGFGIPLLEAMACGCPLIASDIPSTREVAGTIPFYFEVAKSEDLEEALNMCVEKELRKSKQVQAGLDWARQYSWRKTAQVFIDVYRNL
ncbi:MAG TPA: glycosyltransferase family 1 protein [Anaerolineales bacterium]|nr:glycosyltransferase family 1 protein [Anaerolineales bacterium]